MSVSVIVAQKQFLFELIGGFGVAMLVKLRAGDAPLIHPVLIASLNSDGRAVVAMSQKASHVDAFDVDPQGNRVNIISWRRSLRDSRRPRRRLCV